MIDLWGNWRWWWLTGQLQVSDLQIWVTGGLASSFYYMNILWLRYKFMTHAGGRGSLTAELGTPLNSGHRPGVNGSGTAVSWGCHWRHCVGLSLQGSVLSELQPGLPDGRTGRYWLMHLVFTPAHCAVTNWIYIWIFKSIRTPFSFLFYFVKCFLNPRLDTGAFSFRCIET